MQSSKNIQRLLSQTFPSIDCLETEQQTSGRFREKQIIIFEYKNIAGDLCILKFFSLQHIENQERETEKATLLQEFKTIKKFGLNSQVVQVYDANELHHEGQLIGFYITMEKFDWTLDELLKEK